MITHIHLAETILYVRDQEKSRLFYESLFRQPADLHVPGMTEFILSAGCKIGLMPNHGIYKILQGALPHPDDGYGIPRCELYLYVGDILLEFTNALQSGAVPIAPVAEMDWGDKVCYVSDPDGHVIAFAEKSRSPSSHKVEEGMH